MEIQNQSLADLFMVNLWKLLMSTHTLVETSLSLVKFTEEHFLEVLFRLELQETELLRKDQSVWQENLFLQELLHKDLKDLKVQLMQNKLNVCLLLLKHFKKLKHVSS